MRRYVRQMQWAASILILVILVACESNSRYDSEDAASAGGSSAEKMAPPFGSSNDLKKARALWKQIGGDRNGYAYRDAWKPFPGNDGWQDGTSPHGRFLRLYANSPAVDEPDVLPAGSIVIKENFKEKDLDKVAIITVMKKIDGYAPDHGDWFWVKYEPDGDVMKNEKGMSLAGRVAKGTSQGCIACHGNAGGGDYVFSNDA